MALEITTNINVDFYDKRYILINAKQLDRGSRCLSVTCYNQGVLYPINSSEHAAYVRYRKADDYGVFNSCEINRYGKILVKLTEQMLAADGLCDADVIIVNKGKAEVDAETGEITIIDNAAILSSMVFHIDVSEVAFMNSEIESSYEYDALNDALARVEADYSKVIRMARSYAIGNAGGIRENEDTDNAKYYYEMALRSANAADMSETNAANSAQLSKSYAVGSTGIRDGEDRDNSYYYYGLVKTVVDGLNSGFIPMGTISFAELAVVAKATGFTYNINDDFVTDDTFREGAGKMYTAGTNVYYTADGYWDCFGGSASPTATVDEVMEYLGIIYIEGEDPPLLG